MFGVMEERKKTVGPSLFKNPFIKIGKAGNPGNQGIGRSIIISIYHL